MKNLLVLVAIVILSSCSKEEVITPGPVIEGAETTVVELEDPIILYQRVFGTAKVPTTLTFVLYEDRGNGFEVTESFTDSLVTANTNFYYDIINPFYFYIEIHNSSALSPNSSSIGNIGVITKLDNVLLSEIECDELTESIQYTSPVHNK